MVRKIKVIFRKIKKLPSRIRRPDEALRAQQSIERINRVNKIEEAEEEKERKRLEGLLDTAIKKRGIQEISSMERRLANIKGIEAKKAEALALQEEIIKRRVPLSEERANKLFKAVEDLKGYQRGLEAKYGEEAAKGNTNWILAETKRRRLVHEIADLRAFVQKHKK